MQGKITEAIDLEETSEGMVDRIVEKITGMEEQDQRSLSTSSSDEDYRSPLNL